MVKRKVRNLESKSINVKHLNNHKFKYVDGIAHEPGWYILIQYEAKHEVVQYLKPSKTRPTDAIAELSKFSEFPSGKVLSLAELQKWEERLKNRKRDENHDRLDPNFYTSK